MDSFQQQMQETLTMFPAQVRRNTELFLPYMKETVKEIIINQPKQVLLEHLDGSWEMIEDSNLTYETLQEMSNVMAAFSGQDYSAEHPFLSYKLPGGHRVQVISGSYTPQKFAMSIRLQRQIKYTLKDFGLESQAKEIIEAVKSKKTVLISGGTSTGKTSLLNTLIQYIPEQERIVSLEGVPELQVPHTNWCPLYYSENDTAVGNKNISELLNVTLRLRPDRILLGEIRKENAFTFYTATNTGHEGSMATIHANSPEKAIISLINRMIINRDVAEEAMKIVREELEEAIYGVVQLVREGERVQGNFRPFNLGSISYYT